MHLEVRNLLNKTTFDNVTWKKFNTSLDGLKIIFLFWRTIDSFIEQWEDKWDKISPVNASLLAQFVDFWDEFIWLSIFIHVGL